MLCLSANCLSQRQCSPRSPRGVTCEVSARSSLLPFCTAAREEENKTDMGENALWTPDVLTKPVPDAVIAAPSLSCSPLLPIVSSPQCRPQPVFCTIAWDLVQHISSLHLSEQQSMITDMQILQAGHLDLHFQDCKPLSHWCLGLLNYE